MCVRNSEPTNMRMGGPSDIMTVEEFYGGPSDSDNNQSDNNTNTINQNDIPNYQSRPPTATDDMGSYDAIYGRGDVPEIMNTFDERNRSESSHPNHVPNAQRGIQNYNRFMDNRVNSVGAKISRGIRGIGSMGPMSLFFGGDKRKEDSVSRSQDLVSQIMNYNEREPQSVLLGDDGLSFKITTPNGGTINIGKSGFSSYSGMPDPDYTGPLSNLVNPPEQKNEDSLPESTKTPLDPCPDGFVFNSETNSCVEVESDSDTIGSSFVRNTEPMPTDLSRYGRDSGEYRFFDEMPGIIKAKDGIPRGSHGEVKGVGGPKDDLNGPFMLSTSEYVMPAEMVLDEGNGSHKRGIEALEKKRFDALRRYRDRVKSEERDRA